MEVNRRQRTKLYERFPKQGAGYLTYSVSKRRLQVVRDIQVDEHSIAHTNMSEHSGQNQVKQKTKQQNKRRNRSQRRVDLETDEVSLSDNTSVSDTENYSESKQIQEQKQTDDVQSKEKDRSEITTTNILPTPRRSQRITTLLQPSFQYCAMVMMATNLLPQKTMKEYNIEKMLINGDRLTTKN